MLSLSLLFFSFSLQTETTQFHPSLTLCVCVSVSVCCSVYDQQSFKTMTNCQTQRGEGTKKTIFYTFQSFCFCVKYYHETLLKAAHVHGLEVGGLKR